MSGNSADSSSDVGTAPTTRTQLVPHSDGKVYLSYAQIHSACEKLATAAKQFEPQVIVAIGGGGFIPARMLRTHLEVPIMAITVELYVDSSADGVDSINEKGIRKVQWLAQDDWLQMVAGKRVLLVDEVDDTRTTLQYCVEQLMEGASKPAAIAVMVVHNKRKQKRGVLPKSVQYVAAEDVEDFWLCYPWDAPKYGNSVAKQHLLAGLCGEETEQAAQQALKELQKDLQTFRKESQACKLQLRRANYCIFASVATIFLTAAASYRR